MALTRKNHAKAESTRSLRARKLINRRCASVYEPFQKLMHRSKLFLNSALQKAVEFSGAAGEFRCYRLHRSQISKDL
jgi:hypothetical protein